MLLKSLDIQGFKSFPDRTHITFNKGVTVIVGPNGSGKSNISDAIRWVLGEQSTKALRGGKMEDVIFSGAGDRRAMAAAEVSLTIDNSSGFLKSEYNEVTVTRKYYRSGDSEFFINRKTARLRDIHELFMDTGLGRDGYSMISQGKIDEILSVKSEERREMFDEATGISKYRYRREEAERRLADADTNLIRINDMIEDMSARIEPMRIEAEREQKYLDLQEKQRSLEISLIVSALSGMNERLAKSRETAESFARDLEESRMKSARYDEQAEALIRQTADNQRVLEALRDALRSGERRESELREEIAVVRTQQEHIEDDIARMEKEDSESGTQSSDIDAQIASHIEMKNKADRAADIEGELIESLRQEEIRLSTERQRVFDALSAQINAENIENTHALEISGKIETSESVLSELSAQLDSVAGDDKAREETLSLKRVSAENVRKALEQAQEQLKSLENMQAGYLLKQKSRRQRADELSRSLSKDEVETAALENRLSMLRELEKDYEGFNRAVKAVMRESTAGNLRGIYGPVSALMKLDEEYIPAAETALGAAMQNIVVENEQNSRDAIGWLKSRDIGRATFLPLSSLRASMLSERGLERETGFIGILSELVQCDARFKPAFTFLLGRTALVDNLDNAIMIARHYNQRFRIVTLDGQIINSGGSMTGGSLNRSSGILSRANEIEKLEKALPPRREALKSARERMQSLDRELQGLEYQIEQIRSEFTAAEKENARLSAELRAHEAIIESLTSGEDERKARVQILSARSQSLKTEIAQLETLHKEKLDSCAAQKAKRETLENDVQKTEEKLSGIRQNLMESRMRLSGLEAQNRAEAAAIEALKLSKQQIAQRAQRLSSEIEEAKAKKEGLEKKIEALGSQIADAQALCTQQAQKLDRETAVQHDFEKKRIEIERLAQDENRRALALERQSIRAQAELEAVENEESILDSRLWDSYELTRSQAEKLARPIENRSEAERELEKYKRSIRALGIIYPGAKREYDALCQKYEFMSEQKTDAEVSRKEIFDIITDINSRMREIFSEQFAVIAENFGKIFTRIFGGGNAKLRLSDPNNVLESGIDISVQPPGKSLKVLTLLSGGERALAAIALYFAIMTVRPAPFCVLDEIESALDEANIRLFGRYLQEMSENVQFIVISHRRGTMEAADMLYGVAMPKQGISRVLALNVAEAEKEYIKE